MSLHKMEKQSIISNLTTDSSEIRNKVTLLQNCRPVEFFARSMGLRRLPLECASKSSRQELRLDRLATLQLFQNLTHFSDLFKNFTTRLSDLFRTFWHTLLSLSLLISVDLSILGPVHKQLRRSANISWNLAWNSEVVWTFTNSGAC